MLPRDRFMRTLTFQPTDRLPLMDFGYWKETIPIWHGQGLPSGLTTQPQVDEYFGLDRGYEYTIFHWSNVPGAEPGYFPPFTSEVLADEGDNVVERDDQGVIKRRQKWLPSIPQFIRFPVETEGDYEDLRPRLNGADPGRYPPDFDERAAALLQTGSPIGISLVGFFGGPRNLMGLEHLSYAYYEHPELIYRMGADRVEFIKSFCARALRTLPVECAYFWEDMAFRGGSLISPAAFRRFMTPYYQEAIAFLRSHGIKKVLVDCDGDVRDLTALFLEAGLDGVYPCERAAGSDPVELRRRYPGLIMLGGVDKRALIAGPEAIEREIAHLVPIVAEGGFVPGVDHRVPPDVPMSHFHYYVERRKELWGGG